MTSEKMNACIGFVATLLLGICAFYAVLLGRTPTLHDLFIRVNKASFVGSQPWNGVVLQSPSDDVIWKNVVESGKVAVNEFSSANASKPNKCFITQGGYEEFGQQTEGKLSLIVLAELFKGNFTYIHSPYTRFDNSKVTGDEAEEFVGFGKLFAKQSTFGLSKKEYISHVPEFVDRVLSGKVACDQDTLYWHEDAWDYIYSGRQNKAVNTIIEQSTTFHRIRQAYHASSAKVQLGFAKNKPNVVIHINNGTETSFQRFVVKAIQFYEEYFTELGKARPNFIFETDDPSGMLRNIIPEEWGPIDMVFSQNTASDFRPLFHRMIMADGLITSNSSFSRAAAMLRDLRIPIVAGSIDNSFKAVNAYVYIS